ncbi:MAG: acyltransferase [Acidobacteria bacterium]|nr:acyltransferase [Acidobacteriota bacterium]MBI3422768.1 acyltransferase [Acidobacteriota bacterium]
MVAYEGQLPLPGRVKARTAAQVLSQEHVPEFDGVRALAIWLVLLTHIFLAYPNPAGALDAIPRPLYEIINRGWLGVDLFFVLSGLLITGILLDAKGKPHYYRNFYGRRVLRILPLYLACIAVMSLFYTGYGSYFLLSLPFLANFASGFGIATPHGPGVFWSLCVEEHFYLLWPLVVSLLPRRALAVLGCLLLVVSPLLRAWGVQRGMSIDMEVYQYSFFRFDGLALGSLLAIWLRSDYAARRTSLGLAASMIGLAVVVTLAGLPYGILSKSVAGVALRYTQMNLLFGAFIVTAFALRGTWVTDVLRSSFASVSGKLSYCLYLIHLAVGDAYYHLTAPYAAVLVARLGSLGSVLARAATILLLSFGLAWLSQRFLEGPALRLKRYLV